MTTTRRSAAPRRSLRPPPSRRPLKAAQPRRLLGFVAVALAVAGFWQANHMEPVTFSFDRTQLVDIWNEVAVDTAHSSLSVPDLPWTNIEKRTFGHAWTPTLSVIGRTADDSEMVVELVVVGEPSEDGRQRLISAMDVLIATTEPDLTAEQRRRILADLSLVDDSEVAIPSGTVSTTAATFRVAADPELGRLGLGAAPLVRR